MTAPSVLRVELLGGFRVLLDGRSAARPPSARQQQLIAFLVLHARNAPIQRQRVAGSLWPESSDAQALLRADTWRPLESIALASGFAGERQFYRVFRQETGFTPGEFRVAGTAGQ